MKKYNQFKTWLSSKLPTFAEDIQKHFFIIFVVGTLVQLWGSFVDPRLKLHALLILFFIAICWEIPTLIKSKFDNISLKESGKDIAIAFVALFGYAVSSLIRLNN